MKKVSKAILIALGGLLALVVFLLFCVNLYIQSPRVQTQIQDELGKALRLPLKITNTSLSPWKGLRVAGITVPNGAANFLEAASFDASYRFLPLLGGRLVIPEMRVENPKIIWAQDAEGKWKLPVPEKPPDEEPKAAQQAEKSDAKKHGGMTVVVERFVVKKGAIDLLDKDGKRTAAFADVNITYTSLTDDRIEGTVAIGRLVWADSLALENVRSPFTYAGADLTLGEITATLAGGPVRGTFHAQPDAPKSPFEAALNFDQVNLDRLTMDAGWKAGEAGGKIAGKLEAHGDLNRIERAEGPGQLQLRDGQFQRLEIFQTIGKLLGVDLRFTEGAADFHLGGEKLHVDRLALGGADAKLDAKGYVRFSDKKVSLDAQLGFEDATAKRLPDLIRNSFATAGTGMRTIDFNITGSTEKLRTNIVDRLIGQKINVQFDDFLTGIFGGKKKDDAAKKKDDEEQRKKDDKKKKKKEDEKAAAQKTPAATPPPAAPTTSITPVKQ